MANLFTSSLLEVTENPVDVLIDRIDIFAAPVSLEVSKYSVQDEFIEAIIPTKSYIENGGVPETNTRVRVFLDDGQVSAGEKIQISISNTL